MSYTYNAKHRLTPAGGSLCFAQLYLIPFIVFLQRFHSIVAMIICTKNFFVKRFRKIIYYTQISFKMKTAGKTTWKQAEFARFS